MPLRDHSHTSVLDRSREHVFVGLLLFGTAVFALGFAFLILGVTMTTTPPAPYFESYTDKLLVVVVSTLSIIAGLGTIRGAMTLGGWR